MRQSRCQQAGLVGVVLATCAACSQPVSEPSRDRERIPDSAKSAASRDDRGAATARTSPIRAETASVQPVRSRTADWPRFRGPTGAGVTHQKLPVKWSATENIAWKRPLPGPGASSPIVAEDRIYLTCYSGYGLSKDRPGSRENLRRHLVCLDRATGRILWDRTVSHERRCQGFAGFMCLHGYASNTPVTDGRRIYAYFGHWGLYAFDRSGKQLWRFDCGSRTHGFGSGASPILHDKLVIVNASVESGTIYAIDKTTGKEIWRKEGIRDAWNTPVVVTAGGRDELVIATRPGVLALDASTGDSLWKWIPSGTTYVCPSLVPHEGVLYGMPSYGGPVAAIRPGGSGNVSDTHTKWTQTRFRTTVTSPVFANRHLFYAHDEEGTLACFDGATGKEAQRVRLRPRCGRIYASPLAAAGTLYIVTRTRGVYVFRADAKLEQLAHNTIEGDDSVFNASAVPHSGQLLLRSDAHLYCIGSTRK